MLRNGCKEGNVSNLNMDNPFKKNYRKEEGFGVFYLTEKRRLSKWRKIHTFRLISTNECIKMWSSSSDQQLKVTLIIFNS